MSSAPDPHGHDAPDAHAFTGEPVQVLAPDEPRTPGWLPLLGIALFTGAAVTFLAGHGGSEPAAEPKPVQAQPATAPAPPTPAPGTAVMPRPVPLPAPGRSPTVQQADQVRKILDQTKSKRVAPQH